MDFYILTKCVHKESRFAESEHLDGNFEVGEPERCPVCNGAVSILELLPPIQVKLTNTSISDFIFGEITPFLVSDNMRIAYLQSGLTGITSFREVHVLKTRSRKEKVPLKYFLPIIKRSEARIDEAASLLQRIGEVKCAECKKGTIIKSFERLCLLPNTWSGEDIFYAKWLSGSVFASKRFIDFIKQHKLSNPQYVSAVEYASEF